MANIDGFPDNPVKDSDYIEKILKNLKMIYSTYNIGIPYSFDGTLTLEAKYNVLFKTVYDFLNNNQELIAAWNELYTWIKNYFQNLDVQEEINNKLDQIIASGQFDDILNSYFDSVDERITAVESKNTSQDREIGTLETKVSQLLEDMENLQYQKVIVVSKNENEGQFHTIMDAINSVKNTATTDNWYCILVLPGDYQEVVVAENIHGISVIGLDANSVIIHAAGTYPDCVVHVSGDINFFNVTIKNDNNNVYAVHSDVSNKAIVGTVGFYNCIIKGGSNAIGYGGGDRCKLIVKNCTLSAGGDAVLYLHNNPYSNKNWQYIILNNNYIDLSSGSQKVATIDDAANSAGNSNSILYLICNGNYLDADAIGSINFRKNTNTQENYTYIPENDANIKLGRNNNGNNFIPAFNYLEGGFNYNAYITFPANPDTTGYYETTYPLPFDAANFNATLVNAILPGVGDKTSAFSIGGTPFRYGVNVRTNDASCAGKSLSITVKITAP